MLALLMPLFAPVLNRLVALIPDPEARAKALADATSEMIAAIGASDLAQAEINKTEAASGSIFVAGWRPFIGWVCGMAIAYDFLLRPIIGTIIGWGWPGTAPPVLVGEALWPLVTGMLGLGVMRSYDKAVGTSAPLGGVPHLQVRR